MRRRITYATAALLVVGLAYVTKPVPSSPTRESGAQTRPTDDLLTATATRPASQAPASSAAAEAAAPGVASAPSFGTREPNVQQPKPKTQSYVVAPGDTPGGIAEKFGLKTNTILWANDLDEQDVINVGEELVIPAVDGVVYQVRAGDTLWDVAEEYGSTVDDIVRANPDMDPGALKVESKLIIPGGQPISRRQVASSRGGVTRPDRSLDYWPAVGLQTDYFGWRIHPVYGTKHFHDGIDIGVGAGTPVRAASAGTVIMASRYGGYGLAIKIDHGRGLVTLYAHLSQIDVEVGQKVTAGQQIGYSGNTGTSTGPHLHFSVLLNGSPTDPGPFLP